VWHEFDSCIHTVSYMGSSRHGIDKDYIHLFLGARPQKWMETLWKKRVWT
jgi:hypothetical protein